MKLLLSLFVICSLISLNSCGKSDASDGDNDCSLQYVYGKQCIVCSKGGVSCDWN